MKIYHYTTIESLALILKNKTLCLIIRVDDIEEGVLCPRGKYWSVCVCVLLDGKGKKVFPMENVGRQ